MIKSVEAIIVIILVLFSFFLGVKYSESVKNHASWLFEAKEEEEEVQLPDLSNEEQEPSDAIIDNNQNNSNPAPSEEAQEEVILEVQTPSQKK